MKNIIIPLMMFTLCTMSCTYKKWEVKPDTTAALKCDTNRVVSYAADITPFITGNCGSANINCHSSASSSMIPLDVYVGVQYYGQTGQLMDCINQKSSLSPMPKNAAKLSPCDIAMFQKWVNEGEPNN